MISMDMVLSAANDRNDPRPEWLKQMPHAHEPYYLFLYHLAERVNPGYDILEIGTYLGTSAMHLALGNPFAKVVTVDIDRAATELVHQISAEHGVGNTIPVTSKSMEYTPTRDLGLVFIDGNHSFEDAHNEYLRFEPRIVRGGVVCFDDIALNDEMKRLWRAIPEPKVELPMLHYTGFGVAFME